MANGVISTVITLDPQETRFGDAQEYEDLIRTMKLAGVNVRITARETERFAVFDGKLVWHGGMNLLGKADVWDNLIRVESRSAAAELLEMANSQFMFLVI